MQAVINKVRAISKILIEATIKFKQDVARIALASRPTLREYIIVPKNPARPTQPIADNAGKIRPANSVTPKIFIMMAVNQY